MRFNKLHSVMVSHQLLFLLCYRNLFVTCVLIYLSIASTKQQGYKMLGICSCCLLCFSAGFSKKLWTCFVKL